MQKVLLMIDCDWCRSVYENIRIASDDTTAWDHHGYTLVRNACDQDGWTVSDCGNFHYCPNCADEVEHIRWTVGRTPLSNEEIDF